MLQLPIAPEDSFLVSRIVFLAIGLPLIVSGLYSLRSGRLGIMGWQFFAEDRQTIRRTPQRLLRQAGLGLTVFGAGAVLWSAVGFPSPGAPIALAVLLLGTLLLIVVGVSIPYTHKARILTGLLSFIIVIVVMYVVRPLALASP